VEGHGLTREDAEERALQRARERVLEYLLQPNHRLEWRPTLDYIRKNLVKERQFLEAKDFGDPVGWAQGVSLRVEIGPKQWETMLRDDRRLRSEIRMVLSGKVLAGVVAFLG